MNDRLRAMVVFVGVFVVGGATYLVSQPHPTDRTIAELRDAGLVSEAVDSFVLVCPERITSRTASRLVRLGFCEPTACRAGSYKRIARPAYVHDGGELIVPSLRLSFAEDAGTDEDEESDDSLQYRTDDCSRVECDGFVPLLPDAGAAFRRPDGGPAVFCSGPNRLALMTPPCALPACFGADGGWDDSVEVDCKFGGPFSAGGPAVWRGCNAGPSIYAVGSQCLPVECGVVSGDSTDWLR